jgi:hypothetical protein
MVILLINNLLYECPITIYDRRSLNTYSYMLENSFLNVSSEIVPNRAKNLIVPACCVNFTVFSHLIQNF